VIWGAWGLPPAVPEVREAGVSVLALPEVVADLAQPVLLQPPVLARLAVLP